MLTRAVFGHVRAELDWAVASPRLDKPTARALLNLAQLGATALPTGGMARVTVDSDSAGTVVKLLAQGARARLRPEAQAGLRGEAMTEGLPGQWVQPYYLHALVSDAGGHLEAEIGEDLITVRAILPHSTTP